MLYMCTHCPRGTCESVRVFLRSEFQLPPPRVFLSHSFHSRFSELMFYSSFTPVVTTSIYHNIIYVRKNLTHVGYKENCHFCPCLEVNGGHKWAIPDYEQSPNRVIFVMRPCITNGLGLMVLGLILP